ADVLVANDAFAVEDVDGRPAADIPRGSNGALRAALVPPGTPGNVLFFEDLFEIVSILIGVDAEEGERFAFEPFHERPLVRVHGPARPSPIPPEVEDHHFPAIV